MEKFIKNLSRGAGAILRDGFGKKLKIDSKSAPWDVVTQYDKLSDEFIIKKIKHKFPKHGILTEESGHLIKKKDFWVIDPLDGTSPFTKNTPTFSVSIAFVSDNHLKLAAVYQPMTDELFFAEKGKGAFLNKEKIKVNSRTDLSFTLGYTWMHTSTTTDNEKMNMYRNIVRNKIRPTSSGSAAIALCFVACGRTDAVITKGLYPWDYAAGALIMQEAGAKVTDFNNKPYRWDSDSIISANPILHKKIVKNFKF